MGYSRSLNSLEILKYASLGKFRKANAAFHLNGLAGPTSQYARVLRTGSGQNGSVQGSLGATRCFSAGQTEQMESDLRFWREALREFLNFFYARLRKIWYHWNLENVLEIP